MVSLGLLLGLTLLLFALGVIEYAVHRRNLERLPIRIHVNGTRGKSSVTRLISAGLRAGGIRTCAKTTGTQACFILPDGRELPVRRPSSPNVIEQLRVVSAARAAGAQALVIECMALQPALQSLSETRLVRATHGVITNARRDHLEVMGPEGEDVAWALAGMIPPGRALYTGERRYRSILESACRDRGAELIAIGEQEVADVAPEDLAGFSYLEHAENVALALRVCDDLGVDRREALRAMWEAAPDPGVMRECEHDHLGRPVAFVSGFAANDPESAERIWNLSLDRHADVDTKIAVFNCRADRPVRSTALGRACAGWRPADHYVLFGTGTDVFARAATAAGIAPGSLLLAESREVHEVFETIVSVCVGRSLVTGMGNTGGAGLELAGLFHGRAGLAGGPR